MSENPKMEVGTIGWYDLTVANAEQVRDFYSEVVGWQPSPVDMGGYSDFNMNTPASGTAVAGICHARGVNADLPPTWMIYIAVEDIDASIDKCKQLGGEVLIGPKGFGGDSRYCVIKDPAGAIAALYQQGK